MFKVITMSDSAYFDAGKLFLETRKNVNADFVLYGPDLTNSQIKTLYHHDIKYKRIDKHRYETKMQFLKFNYLWDCIVYDLYKNYKGFTFVDFDTFFINDWKHIFDYNFDLGITVRNKLNHNEQWAYSNGGVIFAKHSACESSEHSTVELISIMQNIILKGEDKRLPEYETIWKTLEYGRRPGKTHSRINLRWWVDQVFLSALIKKYIGKYGNYINTRSPNIFTFEDFKIALFSCNYYNVLNSQPRITDEPGIYIKHLKQAGRKALGVDYKIQEKL